jgi:hypothetical protein
MFKDEAYPSEASFRCSTLGEAPGLTHKNEIRLERLARDKQSTSLQKLVNNARKSFIGLAPGVFNVKLFTAVIFAVS